MSRLSFLSLFALLVTLFTSPVFAGTAYYVDCSTPKNGDGTYASPWNMIASVNSYGFSVGDDVYFKEGTICTPSTALTIDWDGTSGDRIIIGCYDGENDFDCSDGGLTRPIIDGNNHTVPDDEEGLIQTTSASLTGYLTIQDLRVNDSAWDAIQINRPDYVIVDNCYAYRPKKSGILMARTHDSTVSNNIVEQSSYLTKYRAGIEIAGMNGLNNTYNITVSGNTVFKAYEGIGVYQGVRDVTVEKNVVYDVRSPGIYLDAVKNVIVRYNLVYESATGPPSGNMYSGIHLVHENVHCTQGGMYPWGNDGHEIYGNLIASVQEGINLSNSADCHQLTNTKVYNNTIVDCKGTNIRFGNVNANWSGNEIKNNISWTISANSNHINSDSPTGVTWSHNNFNDTVSGNAASNAIIGEPILAKISGWRSLEPGEVSGTEFEPLSGSAAKNAGKSLNGYNSRIISSHFTSHPIRVNTEIDNFPDVGAWMIIQEGFLPSPGNLRLSEIRIQ